MLRAKIGHHLLLQSVTVFLSAQEQVGRVLLALDRASGLWMTVGGAISIVVERLN